MTAGPGRAGGDTVNVHVYPSPLRNESRILKITGTLAEHRVFDRIIVVGTWDEDLQERELLDPRRELWRLRAGGRSRSPWAKMFRVLHWSWRVLQSLRHQHVDLVNCHSLSVLPLCVVLKRLHGAKLVYDTHELETETVAFPSALRRVARLVERILLPHADAICVVNAEIAEWYRRTYGLPEVTVVQNVPYRQVTAARTNWSLRVALGIPSAAPMFLYQGVVSEGRGISLLLDAFSRLPDRHLVIMGYGGMVPDVQQVAARYPNIHYHPAVPPDKLPAVTAEADVGLSLVENVCLSYFLSLPNKLFEYLNAGLPVIASDFPVMGRAIRQYEAGWLSPVNAEALHELVAGLDAKAIASAKARARTARGSFGWEMEEPALLAMYQSLGYGRTAGPRHASVRNETAAATARP